MAPAYDVDVTKTRFGEGPAGVGIGLELTEGDEASCEEQPPPLPDE